MKLDILNKMIEVLPLTRGDGGSGGNGKLPKFELTPRDFIAFAEKDLEEEDHDPYRFVNATSNLKRAVDCQLDSILGFLNLDDLYRQKRLGVDRKLGFMRIAGIFNASSLDKLNKYRNRLEHHYELPNVEDVDVYFDVVSAFVTIGENIVSNLMAMGGHVGYFGKENTNIRIDSEIDFAIPSISLNISSVEKDDLFTISLSKAEKPTVDDIEYFAFLLRNHILLIHLYNGAINNERLISDLRKEI